MESDEFKKQFDESFAKVSPEDFVKDMDKLGYKFEPMANNQIVDYEAISLKEYPICMIDNHWAMKDVNEGDRKIYKQGLIDGLAKALPIILKHVKKKIKENRFNVETQAGEQLVVFDLSDLDKVTGQKDELEKILGI